MFLPALFLVYGRRSAYINRRPYNVLYTRGAQISADELMRLAVSCLLKYPSSLHSREADH
jgi:hypothetical protein